MQLPINIQELFTKKLPIINEWLENKHQTLQNHLIYCSIDIRNSGFKIAPVDMNFFPAGFNNLSTNGIGLAAESISKYIKAYKPNASKILLVTENFDRNLGYLENVASLTEILSSYDLKVKKLDELSHHRLGNKFVFHADSQNLSNAWTPDLILLNSDLSKGMPEFLMNLEHDIIPHPFWGWHTRRKETFFFIYEEICQEFANFLQIDSWLFRPYSTKCSNINFKERLGFECMKAATEEMLICIQDKYKKYNIDSKPYVYIKSNTGTFGMGIMIAYSSDDILKANKITRHSMNSVFGRTTEEVIIQEGIPTIHYEENASGKIFFENCLYYANSQFLGGFQRKNPKKDAFSNLNAQHSFFSPIEPSDIEIVAEIIISKLAYLAGCIEQSSNQ